MPKPLKVLTGFETLAERWLEGGFARLFRSRLHRAELAEQLIRALKDAKTAAPNGVWLAPDDYHIFLHPDDYARLGDRQTRAEIEKELTGQLIEMAQQSGMTLTRRPKVRLALSSHLSPRQVEVQASLLAPPTLATASPETREIDTRKLQEINNKTSQTACHLLVDKRCIPLTNSTVSLGRNLDNDIVIDHPRISRHHAQLRFRDDRWWLIDLESANGTAINGQPVHEAILHPGDIISLAGSEIGFELEKPGDR